MPRKRKQHMVKVSTSEDILGNIQSSSKRDIWCSQTKTIIFQLQNSSHQNQEIYGVKTKDFFIPMTFMLRLATYDCLMFMATFDSVLIVGQ